MSEAGPMSGNMGDADLGAEFPALAVPPMGAALSAAIADAKPVPLRRPLKDFGIFLILSIPVLALMLAAMGLRRDLSGLSPTWVASVGLVWLTSFVVSSYFGFVPAKGHIRPRSQNIYQIVAASSLLLISLGLFATQSATGMSMTYSASLQTVMAHAPTCSIMGVTAGVLPGLVALVLMRRYIPVGRWSIGLSLGAAGGSLSGLVLHMHCPITERFHVGLIHGGCVVLSALFVAGAAQILLAERE